MDYKIEIIHCLLNDPYIDKHTAAYIREKGIELLNELEDYERGSLAGGIIAAIETYLKK